MDRRRTSARVGRIVRVVRTIVLSVAFLVVAALVLGLVVLPRATGAVPLTVLSGSMQPSITPGSMVVVRPVDVADLRVGDVITYQLRSGDPTLVTHRIVGIGAGTDEPTFRTRGDNNDVIDPMPVRAVQVRGRVWYHVPLVGHLANQLDGSQREWATKLVAAVLLVWSASLFGGVIRDRLRRGAGRPA